MYNKKQILKNVKFLLLGLMGLAIAVGMSLYFYEYSHRSKAAVDNPVELSFDSSTFNLSTGENGFIDINASSPGKPVSGITMLIRFPKGLIAHDPNVVDDQCNSLPNLIVGQVIPGPTTESYDTLVITKVNTGPDISLPVDTFCAARIYFTGLTNGTDTISFAPFDAVEGVYSWEIVGPNDASYSPLFISGNQKVSVQVAGNSTITPTITPTPSITDGGSESVNINYRVKFQGITQEPKDKKNINVVVSLAQADNIIDTRTVNFSVQGDGTWVSDVNYENIPLGGDYYALIKGAKHLQKKICKNNPTENVAGTYNCIDGQITIDSGNNTLNFSNILLLAGDLPIQDGIINSVDLAYVRNNFSNQSAEVLARGDLNLDGIVDSQDYGLIINSISFKYDEE